MPDQVYESVGETSDYCKTHGAMRSTSVGGGSSDLLRRDEPVEPAVVAYRAVCRNRGNVRSVTREDVAMLDIF